MAEPEETSTLTAIFGKERADTVRKFAKKLAAVEDRLAKEYMEEEDTDLNIYVFGAD